MVKQEHLLPRMRIRMIINLVYRRLLVFYRDKRDLSMTFLQAPLIAAIFFLVFQKIITIGESQSLFQPLRMYLAPNTVSIIIFLSVLTTIWFGASKAIEEIPKGNILYQQEKLSFLKKFDYLFAIFFSLAIITLGQVLLFALSFHILFVFLPAWLQPYAMGMVTEQNNTISFLQALMPLFLIKFATILWLSALAAIAVAMFISAIFAQSRSAANSVLIFLLIAQILFAGSIIKPVIYMTPLMRTLADIMVSRWGFEAAVILFEQDLNLNMVRQQKNEADFTSFHFTYGLQKLDVNQYVNFVLQQDVNDLNQNPLTAEHWRNAMQKAAEEIQYLSDDVSEAELASITQLQANSWDLTKAKESPPSPRMIVKAKEQFKSLYQSVVGNIVSRIDTQKLLTEQEKSTWYTMITLDNRLQLFRRGVFQSVPYNKLNSVEQNKWRTMLDKNPQLTLYRFNSTLRPTNMMLIMLMVIMLLLGWSWFIVRK